MASLKKIAKLTIGMLLILQAGASRLEPWIVWHRKATIEGSDLQVVHVDPFTLFSIQQNPMLFCKYDYVGPKEVVLMQDPLCSTPIASFQEGSEDANLFTSPINCVEESEGIPSLFNISYCNITRSLNRTEKTVRLRVPNANSFVYCEGLYRHLYGDPEKCPEGLMRFPPRRRPYYYFGERMVEALLDNETSETPRNIEETTSQIPSEPEHYDENVDLIADDKWTPLSLPELLILVPLLVFVSTGLCILIVFVILSHFQNKKRSLDIEI